VKILIAADMEGVSGVVHWDHTDSKHEEYKRFRRLMTGDVNAAIEGACEAGATKVLVADGHGSGRNILVEELDPRARLHSGSPSPLAMIQGLDESVDAAMFVGYHARVGSKNAILDHTWSSRCIDGVWLGGRPTGEIGLNAAVCGHFGVPVILVSGDQTACAEAAALLGTVEAAVVKQATGRMAAACLPPEIAQERIRAAAKRAVERLAAGQGPRPLELQAPIQLAIELVTSDMADRVAILPDADRTEGKRVEFVAEDALMAYRLFRSAAALARE
jgi:D-amino peptidase